MKPLIGITGRKDTSARLHNSSLHAVGETYVRAIQKAGATPIILPPVMTVEDCKVILERVDGLLFSGGEDISPNYYRQEPKSWIGGIDKERDESELALAKLALERQIPILGICRGHQILNIAVGGTLYQDLAAEVSGALDHAYAPARPMEQLVHAITISSGSKLAKILGNTDFMVNSVHHQAVRTIGSGMRIVAHAPDGIVEATELQDHPFCISVQWHPESLLKNDTTMLPLFKAFIASAAL